METIKTILSEVLAILVPVIAYYSELRITSLSGLLKRIDMYEKIRNLGDGKSTTRLIEFTRKDLEKRILVFHVHSINRSVNRGIRVLPTYLFVIVEIFVVILGLIFASKSFSYIYSYAYGDEATFSMLLTGILSGVAAFFLLAGYEYSTMYSLV